MEIKKVWFHQLPVYQKIDTTVIMVDANAASSNIPVLLSKKPNKLFVLNEQNLSKARQIYPESILVGESLSLDPREFSASNHISRIHLVEAKGKEILWMSINGSRVLERACQNSCNQVLVGAFNNCLALTTYLTNRSEDVLIIMAGNQGQEVLEDKVCADIIEERLKAQFTGWKGRDGEVANFIREFCFDQKEIEDDLPLLLNLDQFNIVPLCIRNSDGFLEIVNA